MLTIERILCAVEMRLDDINVLASACALARPFRARVDTLLVRAGHGPPISTKARPERSEESDTGREAELLFAELLGATPGSRVADMLVGGQPRAILERSAETASDLIVLGLRHLSAVSPERVGAVAEELSRSARCAVMTVPTVAGTTSISRILLPVDFSTATACAVEWAAALAQRFCATVHVLHAVGSTALREPATRGREPLRTTVERARGRLEEIEQRLRAATVSCESSIAERGTTHAILGGRTRLDSDLIVMGVHDHMAHNPSFGMVATIRCRAPVPVLSMLAPHSEDGCFLDDPSRGVDSMQYRAMGASAAH